MSAVLEFKAKCEHGWTGSPSRCKDCRKTSYKSGRANKTDLRKKVVLTEDGRTCLKCGEAKSWDEFAKDVHGFNQKTATCKGCRNRDYKDPRSGTNVGRPDKIKRLYGITLEHVVHTLDAQYGRCANRACGKEISLDVKGVGGNRAVIDHDHATGKFRALLCSPCNTILGTLETKENIIVGLMEYKTKHTENSRLLDKNHIKD